MFHTHRKIQRGLKALAATLLATTLVGCVTANPKTVSVDASPKTPAIRNITSFTPSLTCMDDLLLAYDKRDIVITSAGIPDATGKIQTGSKDMMISAISRMSVRSNAFRFVDFDPTQTDVAQLFDAIGFRDEFIVPNYYIRGAITQLDAGVTSDSIGGGLALPNVAIGVNKDQIVSLVSIDLNVGELVTRQIIPGLQATNSIAVVRAGKGGDLDGQIGKLGIFFNVSIDRSEGPHQSVRTLIELSVIEALGKLAQVPYWQCLQIDQSNPELLSQARDWYQSLSDKERVSLIQRVLIGSGYMEKQPLGQFNNATGTALARYQTENDLPATGRITFQTYFSMLGNKSLQLAPGEGPVLQEKKTLINEARLNQYQKPVPMIMETSAGAEPTFILGSRFDLRLNLAENGYVYCYYQTADGSVSRIFPNQARPNPFMKAGETLQFPNDVDGFDLVADSAGVEEQIACLASRRELGLYLPPVFQTEALNPIPGYDLNRVIVEFGRLDRAGLTHRTVPIRIENPNAVSLTN